MRALSVNCLGQGVRGWPLSPDTSTSASGARSADRKVKSAADAAVYKRAWLCVPFSLLHLGNLCTKMDWYSLTTLSDDAQAELDLLSATFPELAFDEAKNAATLSVPAREGSDGAARAVTADLSLHLPAAYPAAACVVTVVRSRGGLDDSALCSQLQKLADDAAQDDLPCLYQLIEEARDVMGQVVSEAST